MSLSLILKYHAVTLSAVLVLFALVGKVAAMRGTNRKPLPTIVDKFLRTFFYLALIGPWYGAVPKSRPYLILLSALYLPFYLDGSEKTGSRKSKRLDQDFLLRWFKKRTNLALVRTVPLDPSKRYLFGVHPHGFLPFGGTSNLATDINGFSKLFPGVESRVLAASFCFYIPIYRDLLLRLGFCDASRYVASEIVRSGKSIMLVPGGATEALHANPGTNVLVLRKRLGFIKLALENGIDLVPCFSFGETDTYSQVSPNSGIINWLKRSFQYMFGLSLPLISHALPRPCTITTVVGEPVPCKLIEKPTDKEVSDVLEQYIDAVAKLYNANVAKYTPHVKDPLRII